MVNRRILSALCRKLATTSLVFPVIACAGAAPIQPASAAWPVSLRTEIIEVNEVSWKLRIAAGNLCPAQSTGFGIEIDDLSAYKRSDRALAANSLGLGQFPQVAAIATGSPADLAGMQTGDEIVAVDHVLVSKMSDNEDGNSIAELIMSRLSQKSSDLPATFSIKRDEVARDISVTPRQICASRVILKADNSFGAYSDYRNVALTYGLASFATQQSELALVVGHELAHIILAEEFNLSRTGSREKERRADALGALLTDCSGYDVPTAADFWRRRAQSDGLNFLSGLTHPGAKARYRALSAYQADAPCPQPVAKEEPAD